MKLTITLFEKQFSWIALLDQIGVSWQLADQNAPLLPTEIPVLIVNSKTHDAALAVSIREYLANGGAILTEADAARTLLQIPAKTRRIRYLDSRNDAIFSNVPLCDLPGRREIAADAEHLRDQRGQPTTAVLKIGKGKAIVLPAGFADAIAGYRGKRLNFPSTIGERLPSERVSRVHKGALRRIIHQSLRHLMHFRNLPLIHLWRFPGDATSLFGFRIDTDFAAQQDVNALYETCRRYDIPASWFVETASAADWIQKYAQMEQQEIGFHCFRHRIFKNVAQNLADFLKGLAILASAQLRPRGYAAPFGEWHPALNQALEKSGFLYSSEFAQSYDNLPYYPVLQNKLSTVLQIPIHPVSIGRLHWARHRGSQMTDYYRNIINKKCAIYEPIFLYYHPGEKGLEVFETIFNEIRKNNIPVLSMAEFAKWWQKRAAFRWQAIWKGGKIHLRSDRQDREIWVCVDFPNGKTGLFSSATPVLSEADVGKTIVEKPLPEIDPQQLRRYTKQMFVHDLTWHYSRLKLSYSAADDRG